MVAAAVQPGQEPSTAEDDQRARGPSRPALGVGPGQGRSVGLGGVGGGQDERCLVGVTGLGAAQFALPGAVDRLRSTRGDVGDEETGQGHEAPLVLAATDPAQPYGAALAWPDSEGRPARAAGALVVLSGGRLLAWLDRRGHHLVTFPAAAEDTSWADALAALVKDGRVRALEIRKVDGQPVTAAPEVVASLQRVGFVDGYRGLVLRTA